MNNYELTLVFDSELSAEDIKKLADKIKKIIEDAKGVLGEASDWGKKDLAYPIKKKSHGVYQLWSLQLEGASVDPLSKKLAMEGDLLRCLLVRVEKPVAKQTKTKKGKKNGAKVAK